MKTKTPLALRQALGISREALAARLGISVTWLGLVERQPYFLTPAMARRLAVVFGVRPEDLTRRTRRA